MSIQTEELNRMTIKLVRQLRWGRDGERGDTELLEVQVTIFIQLGYKLPAANHCLWRVEIKGA